MKALSVFTCLGAIALSFSPWHSMAVNATFWVFCLAATVTRYWGNSKQFFPGFTLIGIGTCLNAAACLANGGVMPYLANVTSDSRHIPASAATRLLVLCDIHLKGTTSIGDFFLFGGLCSHFAVFTYLRWKHHRLEKQLIFRPDGPAQVAS